MSNTFPIPANLLRPASDTKRLQSLDLIKGLLMLLVVIDHTSVASPWKDTWIYSMFEHLEVPAFFIVAGYWFSHKSSLKHFLINKANRLLIPLIFFMVLSFGYDLAISFIEGNADFSLGSGIHALLHNRINYPLWFIRAIFVALIILYGISRISTCGRDTPPSEFPRLIAVISFMILSNLIIIPMLYSPYHTQSFISSYLCIPQALQMVPLIYLGVMAGHYRVLERKASPLVLTSLAVIGTAGCYMLAGYNDLHLDARATENFAEFYGAAFFRGLFIFSIAPLIGHLPLINYLGSNSLIVVGIHAIPIHLGEYAGIAEGWPIFLFTLLCLPFLIELLKRYFPHLTAQRALIYFPRFSRSLNKQNM